jgi:hypothetical protein
MKEGINRATVSTGAVKRLVVGLLGLVVVALGCIVPASPTARAATSYRAFWYDDGWSWHHARCTELATTGYVSVYAPIGSPVSRRQAAAILQHFTKRILPTDEAIFGSPRGLLPLTLMVVPLRGLILGYFDDNDLKPGAGGRDSVHSNRGNFLYVRQPNMMPDTARTKDTYEVLAHELSHLIQFRVRVMAHHYAAQQAWLNEGLAFYAQIANGYWTARDDLKLRAASQNPSWPVNSLRENVSFLRRYARVAYGRAGLFVSYLAGQHGNEFIHDLVAQRQTGLSGVAAALRRDRPTVDLPTSFARWAVASYVRGSGVYGFASLPLRIPAPRWRLPPITSLHGAGPWDVALRPWSQAYLRFQPPGSGDLHLTVSGPSRELRVAAVVQDSLAGPKPVTRVIWLRPNRRGYLHVALPDFGFSYNAATLVISRTGSAGWSTPGAVSIEVRAHLFSMGDYYRSAGTTAPASSDHHGAVRQVREVD